MDKLDDIRKKKLEEMVAATRTSGSNSSNDTSAATRQASSGAPASQVGGDIRGWSKSHQHFLRIIDSHYVISHALLFILPSGSLGASLCTGLAQPVMCCKILWVPDCTTCMLQRTFEARASKPLSPKDTNSQVTTSMHAAKKPGRMAPASSAEKTIADDDDAALQVLRRHTLVCKQSAMTIHIRCTSSLSLPGNL
jgi:hypothetical protein